MKRVVWGVLGLAGALAGCAGMAGGQEAVRTLVFSLDRQGGAAAIQYTMLVGEDGRGTYAPHLPTVTGTEASGSPPAAGEPALPITVQAPSVKKLFAAVPAVEGGRCETHSKGIARTGVKELRYQGAGKKAACSYNFSDDDRLNEATTIFEAVAETLQAGDRLRAKLRFDRLGLDAELDLLQGAVADHRALEVQNIAPVLKAIVADERVMDRAQRKAERLLLIAGDGHPEAEATVSER